MTFYNLREGKTVRCTEIDVSQLIAKSNYFMFDSRAPGEDPLRC